MARHIRSDQTKPIVGVTGNHKWFSPSWWCIKLGLILAGAKPKRISIVHQYPLEQLDAIVISGGDDIHPELYGEEVDPDIYYDEARDQLESSAILYAFKHNLPMLGICRGYQLINVMAGGSLFSDIKSQRKLTSNKNQLLPKKQVQLTTASKLAQLFNTNQIKVNSLHHQAVNKIGEGFNQTGQDLDGFTQAIEHQQKNIIGVQWHPEYLLYLKSQRRLFNWLVKHSLTKST
ncbi:gamma-glutamyl-gamma-aminobutyrate hydrolase family protein [Catenovulum sp. 2E275]|uniref:gamma-glutamyl-gamma-aminobutyrate hydrolase family protein n=1 Tax=Catenovulum sp. 2E275 TaxID=2980497 RepID=UPI0021D1F976|nr:gamma-glutamyl-gamma-aminobutyrate hydrolase family protein [Catenovulum sp. 2E275]MCU4676128.1 gamma-glutamyl-gamma-aminobutyrate hydrolase family protein [Catenovulum sp. 2E275]